MAKKLYPCEKGIQCEYSGNKYYNYGFLQGTANYCRKYNQFTNGKLICERKNKNENE